MLWIESIRTNSHFLFLFFSLVSLIKFRPDYLYKCSTTALVQAQNRHIKNLSLLTLIPYFYLPSNTHNTHTDIASLNPHHSNCWCSRTFFYSFSILLLTANCLLKHKREQDKLILLIVLGKSIGVFLLKKIDDGTIKYWSQISY